MMEWAQVAAFSVGVGTTWGLAQRWGYYETMNDMFPFFVLVWLWPAVLPITLAYHLTRGRS